MRLFKILTLGLMLSIGSVVHAQTYQNDKIDHLLSQTEEPDGVVFEILEFGSDSWQWLSPMLESYTQQLRAKFPTIDIAIVSHGLEQFELTKEASMSQPKAMNTLKGLSNQSVDVHVCGVHSRWLNVDESAYLDFVNVAKSGPAKINDYRNIGYTLIEITQPRL